MPKTTTAGTRLVFTFLVLITIAAINFEAVFAVPIGFLRAGAKLKMSDFMGMILSLLFLANCVYYMRIPKAYRYFLLCFAVLLICSIIGPALFKGYMYVTAVWFFLSFTSSYAVYDFLNRQSSPFIIRFLNIYLGVATVIYIIALIDYFALFFGIRFIPPDYDQRLHQYVGGLPRFEGLSPLSLAFIPLGYFHFALGILLKRQRETLFFLMLMLFSVSIGGMVAAVIAFSYYLFTRMSTRSKLIVLLPVVWFAFSIVSTLVEFKIQTAGKWSYGVRLELYLLTPTVVATDPLGMGFGQSRYVFYSAKRYDLKRFEDLYNKGVEERTFVVESSHLEVIYEFGILGIIMILFYTLAVSKYGMMALRENDRKLLIMVSVIIFFYIHAFFNPSYFYQAKFWTLNLICILITERFSRFSKLQHESNSGALIAPGQPAHELKGVMQ